MRIAINTRFLLPNKLEGLGWYTHELVRRMVLRHPEHEFIFLFDRPFDPAFVYAPNVRPEVLFPPARHPVLWYAWFEWALPGALRRLGADVFFSPDGYLSLRAQTRSLMTVHDLFPLQYPEQVPWQPRAYYRFFIPRYIRRADCLLVISEHVKQSVLEVLQADPSKITVVYNGCRDGFCPLPEPDREEVRRRFSGGTEYFFYTGAIHPRKNIPRLIRAFDAFKKRTGARVKLLLAGRFAWHTGPVRSAYEAAGYNKDIIFLGYVSEADLQGLMASALALVYVSLSEGFGLPVLEAFHSEVPVICSDTSALPEVAGDAALLVNPLSEHEISQGLERIYADPALRATLTGLGRRQRLKFNWDTAAAQIFDQLINF